jgi:DNA helicase HerA-like ATPase
LGQLGNRIQHALRAFTPRDQKAVKAAAETFRANPAFDAATAITELGVGEALVSTLDEKGAPTMVERMLIVPPAARIGPATKEERQAERDASPVAGEYDNPIDRESAYEMLTAKATVPTPPPKSAPRPREDYPVARDPQPPRGSEGGPWRTAPRPSGRQREGVAEAFAKSAVRAIGSSVGRQIVRGILGAMLKGR